MKVYAISDLHLSAAVDKPMDIFGGAWDNYWQIIKNNWKELILEDDIVLIAGDISWGMTIDEAKPDIEEIGKLPGHKIIVKGNHDYWWSSVSKVRNILPEKMYVLQNDAFKLGSFIVTGTRGWTCPDKDYSEEDRKIYNRETERLKLALAGADKLKEEGDTVIGMMHYPPFNVRRESSGFTELFEKYNIRNVVYGHLHGKNCRADLKVNINGVIYHLTSCDLLNNMPLKLY